MKCFTWKDKTKVRQTNARPVLNDQNKSENLAGERATKSSGSRNSITQLYQERAQSLRVFSFSELRKATNDFNRLLKIGEGGFGDVYKGSVKPVDGNGSPIVVAVKKLNRDSHQGHKQWEAEVQFLGIVEHPNLVKLIGYCATDGERGINRLLVYEFMPNGTLADHLFGKVYPALPWQTRLQIVLGAAQGLAYLHEELEVQVIYRDFKSSNVLLDEDFKPKLSDFGLAREGPTVGQTHVSTAVLGTYGYAAPDYIETGRLTSKSDVWSFGVVLYEIITGKRSLDRNRPRSEQKLLDWVKQYPVDSKKFCKIMDPRLENNYSLTAARAIAKLADSCLLRSSTERPKMSEVVESLTRILQVSREGSPSNQGIESLEDDETANSSKKPSHTGPSKTARMRMAHLAKLSEHVDSKRKFMLMHRANLT